MNPFTPLLLIVGIVLAVNAGMIYKDICYGNLTDLARRFAKTTLCVVGVVASVCLFCVGLDVYKMMS